MKKRGILLDYFFDKMGLEKAEEFIYLENENFEETGNYNTLVDSFKEEVYSN